MSDSINDILTISQKNGEVSVTINGKFNSDNADYIGNELKYGIDEALGNDELSSLVFDFSGLIYISSTGLRQMLKIKKSYPDAPMAVKNASETVASIFEVTGFDDYFSISKVGEPVRFNRIRRNNMDNISLKHGYFE